MPRYSESEIAEADATLALLGVKIQKADVQLTVVQNKTADATRLLQDIKQQHRIRLRQYTTDAKRKQSELAAVLDNKMRAINTISLQHSAIAVMIDKATTELKQIRVVIQEESDSFAAIVATHTENVIQMEREATRYRTEVLQLEQRVKEARSNTDGVETATTTAKSTFADTTAQFQETIQTWENKLQKVKHEFGTYEASMQAIRGADAQRTKELDDREQRLKAEERKLNEDRRDFKEARDRFYQTKELQ